MRPVKRLAVAASLLLGWTSPVLADPIIFQGGAFDGLRAESLPTGGWRFLPGVATPRPVAAPQRAAIATLTDRLRRGGRLGRITLAPIAIALRRSSGAALEREFRRVVASCRSDTPYALDEEKVRIGWLCGGHLAWLGIYGFSGNAVQTIQFGRAEVAVVEAPAGR
jgi:hypothetical protein